MRLLVVAHGLWYGGAQVSILELLKLIRSDVEVSVLACESGNQQFINDVESLGIPVRRVPYRMVRNYPDLDVRTAGDMLGSADAVWISDVEYLVAPRIKRIRKIPIVAHLHSYALVCPYWSCYCGSQGVCMKPCNMRRIIKCKRSVHDELQHVKALPELRARLYKFLDIGKGPLDYALWPLRNTGVMKQVDGFIAVSNAVREVHLEHLPGLDKPIEVVYNCVSIPPGIVDQGSEVRRDPKTLLYIEASGGQITKGPQVLIRAVDILRREGKDFKIVMLGSKGTWVERYANHLGLADKVTFQSRLPRREDVYRLMLSSAALVAPSVWSEPFGMVALEANLLGVPVVASNVGGLREIVEDGITGFLVAPNNPESLAEGINKALNFLPQKGSIAAKTASRFDPEKSKKLFLNFIETISSA